ncbi:hypothetical protein [Massilia aerilata]|uniref:Secreted protein n=1 Tax=Massilia aerilata TaxID=453817 RepID=A0ABW0S476_9BURK
MKQFLISLALLLPSLTVLAQDYLPRDVHGFMNRREDCDQLRRVAPDARERLLKLCVGTDKELVQLKRKYARNSTIMQILNQFEAGIEIAEAPSMKKKAAK